MATILELGKLSGHIYRPYDKSYAGLDIHSAAKEDIMQLMNPSGWFRFTDVDPYMTPASSFYAQLYVKFEKGEAKDAVMAIRGTVPTKWDNIKTDIYSWFSDIMEDGSHEIWPAYLAKAIPFYRQCCDYVHRLFPHIYKIHLTGHSLGGAIAKLLVLTHAHTYAIAFNAPGCGHMPLAHKDRFNLIYNIDARYGIINKIGLTIGHIYVVDVSEDEEEAKALFDSFNQSEYRAAEKVDEARNKNIDPITSNNEYISDTLHGAALKAKSYLSALGGLDKLKSMQARYSRCHDRYERHWYDLQVIMLSKIVEEYSCKIETKFSVPKEVIIAQHAMLNMVKTLYQQKYASISMKRI